MFVTKTLFVGGSPVAYAEQGSGPVCVLVHGVAANRNYWRPLAKELGGRHVFMPDMLGHGETPTWHSKDPSQRRYRYQDDVRILEAIVDLAASPVDLIGHSGGGSVCIEFALRHPTRVRRLVLAEPMLPTMLIGKDDPAWLEVSTVYRLVHADADGGDWAGAVRRLYGYILGDGAFDQLPDGIKAWMTDNVALLTAHSNASITLTTKLEQYAALEMPTLLMNGSASRRPYQRLTQCLAGAIEGAQLEVIAGATHNAPLTHAAQVNPLIVEFLNASTGQAE